MNEMKALARALEERARALGFDLFGIAALAPPPQADRLQGWLAAGNAGELGYLARRSAERTDPRVLMPEGRAVVVVGKHYRTAEPLESMWRDPARGRISRYAWGLDYHEVLTPRLQALVGFVQGQLGRRVQARQYVDTGPVLERPMGAAAGLGFVGKNTMLIHPQHGSWFFLAEILVDVPLEPTVERARGDCGTCQRCQQVCPTKAFAGPYVLDARRCISYLTIELKGPIPHELRPMMGNRIFGCDDCQEVCPWNIRFGASTDAETFAPDPNRIAPLLLELIALDGRAFSERFRHSPVQRAKRRGLLRNVAVALGNWGDARTIPALSTALADSEALVRGHAAWALGRIGTRPARDELDQRLPFEQDAWVEEEIRAALDES